VRDAHADTPAGSGDDRDLAVEHTHDHCPLLVEAVGGHRPAVKKIIRVIIIPTGPNFDFGWLHFGV
jgi:hypothetical protein